MTSLQTRKYWQTWGRVRKVLTELGEFSKTDADEERGHIHEDALGKKKSSKDFKNADLDKVLDAFDKILVFFDGPSSPNRATEGPIKRLIWAIDQLGLDEPYIAKIATDTYRTADWRTLTERQLTHFRYTLTRAARAKKAALK